MVTIRRSWRTIGRILFLATLAVLASGAASAQYITSYYTAVAITTGNDTRYRAGGFAECLREVLVKVSGDPRLRDDPRVDALAAHAEALIQSFDYVDQMAGIPRHDEQGTYDRPHNLTVRFVPERIDAALAELGETPWRGERPVILPVLLVRGLGAPFTQTYLLSADRPDGATQRAAFAAKARDYGMTLHIPTMPELAAWGVDGEAAPVPHIEAPQGHALVYGVLSFKPAEGWTGDWHMRLNGADYAWRVSGVNYDKAFESIVSGIVRVASGRGAPG